MELLEDRLAPAGDPVVGRTLSTYTTAGVQNNAVTVTYTVYNPLADDVTGVLLTTTLQPGIDIRSSSVLPDRSGRELAWNLGTVPAFGRASVQVTLGLPSVTPLQLDSGAKAFGTLDAGIVSDFAPAATLSNRIIPADQLASTADANTTDPFVQQQAAALDYDPQAIFDFLNDDIGYESYIGSLRGARGTLWSVAGNSLDEASLGVALFRASGIPARYAQGTLSDPLSQQLILSMFPEPLQTVGYIPPGTLTADPANDPKLLAETRNHYWIQIDTGTGFQNADTSGFAGGGIGTAFTAVSSTFVEVADNLRHKVHLTLDAEIYNSALAAFGIGSPLLTSTVLDRTFNAVDLVGKPLSIGHFVNPSAVGIGPLSARINTYSPYLIVGDYSSVDQEDLIRGTDYQEVITNFPLATTVVTGLFLGIELSGPDGPSESYTRTLADRIGFDIRQNGGSPNLQFTSDSPPLVSDYDAFTLFALPGLSNPRRSVALPNLLQSTLNRAVDLPPDDLSSQTDHLNRVAAQGFTRLYGEMFLRVSDLESEQLAATSLVQSYFDRPRLVLTTARTVVDAGQANLEFSIDLWRNTTRVLAAPGQSSDVSAFRSARGLFENANEESIFSLLNPDFTTPTRSLGAIKVFETADALGIDLAAVTNDNFAVISTLGISAEAKARITAAVASGKLIVVPVQSVPVDGVLAIAWLEIDQTTGEIIGVSEDGGHLGVVEFAGLKVLEGTLSVGGNTVRGLLLGVVSGQFLGVAGSLYQLSAPDAAATREFIAIHKQQVLDIAKILSNKNFNFDTFSAAFTGTVQIIARVDPPLPGIRVNPLATLNLPVNDARQSIEVPATVSAGSVANGFESERATFSGRITASWASAASNGFRIQSLVASSGTVFDAGGGLVGLGSTSVAVNNLDASFAGTLTYDVTGSGDLSFYSEATTGTGVSGDWFNYTATVAGIASITLTVPAGALTLNGQPLPAGTYTITTSSATLTGNGRTASPSFAGSVSVAVANGTVNLGPGTGSISVGGVAYNADIGTTLTGYTGTVNVAAGQAASDHDSLAIAGTTTNVLRVTAPSALTADQNTPVTFQANIVSSFAGTYTLRAVAPEGWIVGIDPAGNITATPAAGTQSGSYPVRIVAISTTNPDLVAQAIVNITVTATAPGLNFEVVFDPILTVPYQGAQVPAAYQATLQNLGPATDTYTLSFANPPPSFSVLATGTAATIPAGQTGIIGLYFEPNVNTILPAPGTVITFDVTATSTTDPGITQTRTVSFTVPEIRAVMATPTRTAAATVPGLSANASLDLRAVGNVADTVELILMASNGITVAGLPDTVSLNPGQSLSLPFTISASDSIPLNSTLSISILVRFGSNPDTEQTTLIIPVRVVVPGADAIANAATAAAALGNGDLANRLNDLSIALTNLVQTPTSPVFKSQALANLDSIRTLLLVDPILATFAAPLADAADDLASAQTAGPITTAVVGLGAVLDDFAAAVEALVHHRVEVLLAPNTAAALPNVPQTFGVLLRNAGDQTTTYDLSFLGLPASVTGSFSQTSVTLAPGAYSSGLTATLTQTSIEELLAFEFRVQATAAGTPLVSASAAGTLQTRRELVSVASIGLSPTFTDSAGGTVAVTARVLNAVNRQQEASAYFEVRNSTNQIEYISDRIAFTLGVVQSLTTLTLGSFDTTGYADGEYTVNVVVLDADGFVIPGAIKDARLFVGSPVNASTVTTSTVLPPGTNTATTTVTVSRGASAESGLELVGQITFVGDTLTFANIGRFAGRFDNVDYDLLYVGGELGVYVVNVSDPANPVVIRRTGPRSNSIVVDGERLLSINQGPGNLIPAFASGTLTSYSLTTGALFPRTTPANPFSTGALNFDYQFVGNPLVIGNVLYAAEQNVFFTFTPPNVFHTQGDVVSFDISNPQSPQLLDVLDNTFGTTRDAEGINSGGPNGVFQLVQADATTLYAASTMYTIQNDVTTPGTGIIRLVDITDPAALQQVGTIVVPNTTLITSLTIVGDRAYVVGSEGGWRDPFSASTDLGPTGRIVITTFDISQRRSPVQLGQSIMERSARLAGTLIDLGNGRFALTSAGEVGDTAKLYELDLSTPGTLVVVQETDLTDSPLNLTYDGEFLYLTDAVGLKIFSLAGGSDISTQTQVTVPKNTGVTVVPGSFNVTPDLVVLGTDSDTYIWDGMLSDASPSAAYTFQTTITGLQPGESRNVTVGTSIDFNFLGSPGVVTVPSTNVAAEQVLGLAPSSNTVRPGETAVYTLTVSNPANIPVTYELSVQGVPPSWVTLPGQVTVAAGATVEVPVTLVSDPFAPLADYGLVILATVGGTRGTVEGTLTLEGSPLIAAPQPLARGVVVEVLPPAATAGQGTSAAYRVRVTNTGSEAERFTLSVAPDLPADVSAVVTDNTADITPGAGNFREFNVVMTSRIGAAVGDTGFTATATSPSASASARSTLTVAANGVSIALDRVSGAPGETFQLTLTNTGLTEDTFDLTAAGPLGVIATVSQPRVTLPAGGSRVVSLTIGSAPFMVPGDSSVFVIARSVGNPAVVATAEATLRITSTNGLDGSFVTDERTLTAPGTAEFLYTIENTGNTEDSYTVTILSVSGPATASLVGPDGLPTQRLEIVRVPGLAKGLVQVRATTALVDESTLTLQVQSLNEADRVTQDTATLRVSVPAPVVTGIQPDTGADGADGLTNSPRLIIVGTALPAATVTVFRGGTSIGSAVANSFGRWELDGRGTSLADGPYTFTATATLGSVASSLSAAFNVVVDTAPPAVSITGFADDTSPLGDGRTMDSTLVLFGTAEAGSTVIVSRAGFGVIGTITAGSSDAWTFDYSAVTLPAGSFSFTAVARDAAGSTSETAGPLVVQVESATTSPPVSPRPPVNQNEVSQFAISGSAPRVDVRNTTSAKVSGGGVSPFSAAESPGGTRTALADVTGDGVPDLIVGVGPGAQAEVRVIDGRSGNVVFVFGGTNPARMTAPLYEPGVVGGVFVAGGDFDGDGRADIVVSPDTGGSGRVVIYSGLDGRILANFFGIDDPSFRGGARVAVGDLNRDGLADLAVAAGTGGGPRVALYDGLSLRPGRTPARLTPDFYIFESALRNGAYITLGDLNGDGWADVIAGGALDGSPRVYAIDGRALLDSSGLSVVTLVNFFADDDSLRLGGAQPSAKFLDDDMRADLLVAVPTRSGTRVVAYLARDISADGRPTAFVDLFELPNTLNGVYVG